jgi:hypothetical protein
MGHACTNYFRNGINSLAEKAQVEGLDKVWPDWVTLDHLSFLPHTVIPTGVQRSANADRCAEWRDLVLPLLTLVTTVNHTPHCATSFF